MSEADGSLDGDPMSEAEAQPPQAATGGRGSESGGQVDGATPTTAGVRGNEGGGEVTVFPQGSGDDLPPWRRRRSYGDLPPWRRNSPAVANPSPPTRGEGRRAGP